MNSPEPPPVALHLAEMSDVPLAARLLAETFADYPWTRWTIDGDRHAERLHALYELVLGRLVAPYGRLSVAATTTGDVVGAAGWLPPQVDAPADALAELDEQTRRLRGSRSGAATAAETALAAHASKQPHWYLGTIGVAPAWQGHGIGAQLLSHGNKIADETGHRIRLETSAARNLSFYRRHGYHVVTRLSLPEDAPPCWVMERPPGAVRRSRRTE